MPNSAVSSRFGNHLEKNSKIPIMPSIRLTGTGKYLGFSPIRPKSRSACSLGVYALPGPPIGSILFTMDSSETQLTMKDARSLSLMGLHAQRSPSPKYT